MSLKSKIFLTVNILILMCIFAFETYISRYGSLFIDDIHYGMLYPGENIWDLLYKNAGKVHGGGFINLFMTKLFCWELPEVFNVHPADFAVFPMCFIKALIVSALCFYSSKFVDVFSKNNIIQPLILLLFALVYFAGLNFVCINNNVLNFFRYNFSLLVFCIFWLYIIKNILKRTNKRSLLNILFISPFALILGSNLEICIFSSVLNSCLIIIYNLTGRILKFNRNKLYNLNLKFYLPVIIVLSSALWFVNTEGFRVLSMDRGLGSTVITKSMLIEFLKTFWTLYISEYIIFWIFFIVLLFIGFYQAAKIHNYKRFLLPIFMQISITTVFLSLILCGKTLYGTDKFWIEYGDVIFTFKIISLIPFALLIGFITRYFKKSKWLFSFLIILICISQIPEINRNALIEQEQTRKIRQMNYIFDKLYQFYYIKGKTPIMPLYRENSYYRWNDYSNVTAIYLKRVYKQNIDCDNFKVIKDENAMEIYKKNGGILTEEELNNLKFSNLLNDRFYYNAKNVQSNE